jgi:hypothetical protein
VFGAGDPKAILLLGVSLNLIKGDSKPVLRFYVNINVGAKRRPELLLPEAWIPIEGKLIPQFSVRAEINHDVAVVRMPRRPVSAQGESADDNERRLLSQLGGQLLEELFDLGAYVDLHSPAVSFPVSGLPLRVGAGIR